MNVTFIDPCNYANYSAPTLNNVTLFYMGPTFNFAWPAFQDKMNIVVFGHMNGLHSLSNLLLIYKNIKYQLKIGLFSGIQG